MDTTICSTSFGEKDDLTCIEMLNNALNTAKSGDLSAGYAKLEECLEHGTSNFNLLPTIYMWLGRVSNSLGLHEKSFSYYQYEVQLHKVNRDMKSATDAYLRLTAICMKLDRKKRAKKVLKEFIEYAQDENDCISSTIARIHLIDMLLDEAFCRKSDNLGVLEEAQKLLGESREYAIGDELCLELDRLEAKYTVLVEKSATKAIEKYQKCINKSIQRKNYAKVHELSYEMARFCYQNELLSQIEKLNCAINYAKKCNDLKIATFYMIKLSACFEICERFEEAYECGLESIEQLGNSDMKLLQEIRLTICKALVGMKNLENAVYYLVIASISAVEQKNDENLQNFYEIIDKIMQEIKTSNIIYDEQTITIKFEQTTTFEVWKMTINEIIEAKKARELAKLAKKEEPELDLFEMIARLSEHRMEDQRTVLPPSFAVPRSTSRQSKTSETKKKGKSFALLPGLRIPLHKLQDLKIDKKRLNSFLKSKPKNQSKVSLESDQESVCDSETIGDLASLDSVSLNKENMQHS
ncbi:unnamed protein product [Caenorhabditis angaria]|uniref:Uncharacterized protein n=1 Tax=Caenorhabditis angaria TaxID=860376 RepID=A0A9P1IHE4_9PELO|nr:unnamed protein product [Caenorhabditis angaria]